MSNSHPLTEPHGPVADHLLEWIDRRRHWLFAAMLLLYLMGFNGQWHVGPDSALHLGIARNIAAGKGFFYPGGEHMQVHPGLAYLMAPTFWAFGPGVLWPAQVIMFLIGLGALVLHYALIATVAGRAVAVLTTAVLGSTETFYRYAFQVLTDMPFLVGLLLCLLGFELSERSDRGRWWPGALIVLGTLTMAAFRSVVLTAVVAMVLMLIWMILSGRRRAVASSDECLEFGHKVRVLDPFAAAGAWTSGVAC